MAHVITISFPNGLCSRITTVGLIINITIQPSSGKIKTYINIFDIELLALTKSPLDLRNRLRQYYGYGLKKCHLFTSYDSWLTMAAINS